MKHFSVIFPTTLLGLALLALPAHAQRAKIPTISQDPYLGAITVDAATGKVLFEKNADASCFPASIVKLMDLLIILEDVQRGSLQLTTPILSTAEAANMGGSQVYLREHESFSIDELLYALMVQSANDAATALAIGIAGSKDAFTLRMNQRAQQIGMANTVFHSVHGLPPGAGQEPDVSTPRDLTLLAREALKHAEVLRYTSTKTNAFRAHLDAGQGRIDMKSHNGLLWSVPGCDGLKTGYFRAGGFSVIATAARDGKRVITVVVGSVSKDARDRAAAQLLTEGLALAMAPPPPPPKHVPAALPVPTEEAPATPPENKSGWGWKTITGIAVGVALIIFGIRRRRLDSDL